MPSLVYQSATVHSHAQTVVERDRKMVRVLSGCDLYFTIAKLIAISIRFKHVWSY